MKPFFSSLLLFLSFFHSCEKDSVTPNSPKNLKLIANYDLAVPEPSGLALDRNGNHLWTVSDRTNKVYKMTSTGDVIKILSYVGSDLEGITQNPFDAGLWIVEESARAIIHLDTTGNEIERFKITLTGQYNSGLEGITHSTKNDHLYVINEKFPCLLIELDKTCHIQRQFELNFVDDISGICYDNQKDLLWVVSDQSELAVTCDLAGNGLESYLLGLPQAEGIAVDAINNLIYIVSDSTEQLYVFSCP